MSTFYRAAYRLGFHPWEDAGEHPPFVERIAELFDHVEDGREPPYGRALDVGTGCGIWAVELAKRGWRVPGIDVVDRPLRRARERTRTADVDVRLAVPKVRGGVALNETIKLELGDRIRVDTSRDIA